MKPEQPHPTTRRLIFNQRQHRENASAATTQYPPLSNRPTTSISLPQAAANVVPPKTFVPCAPWQHHLDLATIPCPRVHQLTKSQSFISSPIPRKPDWTQLNTSQQKYHCQQNLEEGHPQMPRRQKWSVAKPVRLQSLPGYPPYHDDKQMVGSRAGGFRMAHFHIVLRPTGAL